MLLDKSRHVPNRPFRKFGRVTQAFFDCLYDKPSKSFFIGLLTLPERDASKFECFVHCLDGSRIESFVRRKIHRATHDTSPPEMAAHLMRAMGLNYVFWLGLRD